MEVKIYRGTHQIGGCVTEISCGDTRIFVDFGSELPAADGKPPIETLHVAGVTDDSPRCDGIFFTHTHGDHIGQLERIHPRIPLWLGETAKELCLLLNHRLQLRKLDRQKTIDALQRANTFRAREPVVVGSIKVTPLMIDHSAFDAYMFLIEGDGKRILHTGDFRGHGFRGKALIPMLKTYVGKIDWLICEGTMLSRGPETVKSERQLQGDERSLMEQNNRVFVVCSSMNIDRIAGFCKAVPDRRPILCDDFQKKALDIVQARHGIYTSLYDFSHVRVYYQNSVKLNQWMEDKGFLCFIRANYFSDLLLERYGEGSVIAYSMWAGYLSGTAKNERLSALLAGRNWVQMHTSGHATVAQLREVYDTVSPRYGIIPIHTDRPDAFLSVFPANAVYLLADGQQKML